MGGLWLQATHFDTLYYMETEAMCRKWPRMVRVGMENVCILIKCNARWDFVGLRCWLYKGLLQQTGTKAAAHTLLSLFTCKHGQAWQDTQDKKKWLLVIVSGFSVNASVNGPCLVWVRFRPSIPISVHVSTGELYK